MVDPNVKHELHPNALAVLLRLREEGRAVGTLMLNTGLSRETICEVLEEHGYEMNTSDYTMLLPKNTTAYTYHREGKQSRKKR